MSAYEVYYNAFRDLGLNHNEAAAEASYRAKSDSYYRAMNERFPEPDADEYVGEEY